MREANATHRNARLLIAAFAAFCTYFCMYAFRKPFTAGTFEGQEIWGLGLKSVLVISQLMGYMLSKFIGIKVVSEMRTEYRAVGILGLILVAEMALVGFALVPTELKFVMLFLNGLPLGLVFGLVLAYLEGRKQTEALTAALCASFIMSSGVVKSIGRWLIQDMGIGEYTMPMWVGAIFLAPLLVSVWLLQRTPPPDNLDRQLRAERAAMNRPQRNEFLSAYWPGLSLLVFVFVTLTIVRTARDDFGVEIWRDLGVSETPSVFAVSETIVAVLVTALNAFAIWIPHNLTAIKSTILMMCVAFCLIVGTTLAQSAGMLSALVFMIACGVGLYVPYVAFHTTIFERIIAASRLPGNLGFLMYLADAMGYLGYSAVMVARATIPEPESVLPTFRLTLYLGGGSSILALVIAMYYFQQKLGTHTAPSPAEPHTVPKHARSEPLFEVEEGASDKAAGLNSNR